MALVSTLIALHDWDSAEIAIQQHTIAVGGLEPQALSIQAIVEAMRGEDEQAIRTFQQAVAQDGQQIDRYDFAVFLVSLGRAQEALSQLDMLKAAETSKAAARIEALRGKCLVAVGDINGARKAFLHVRVLDPHELKAALELQKLEDRGDQ
jgi:predicted negative regulator of RcsB-dependent stress response